MSKNRRFRCWACGSFATIKWGKRLDKQRYKCTVCGKLSTRTNPGVSKKNCEHWFRAWIVGKQTFTQLVKKSGYSERTLKRLFYDYLNRYPAWQIVAKERVNLLIVGGMQVNVK
jgi:transposase-like protein